MHWKDWCWGWSSNAWPPAVKNWLIGKDPDAGKDWRREEKGTTEDEMVGWHHQLDGHEFEQGLQVEWTGKPGVPRSIGCKESDTTEQLNWTSNKACQSTFLERQIFFFNPSQNNVLENNNKLLGKLNFKKSPKTTKHKFKSLSFFRFNTQKLFCQTSIKVLNVYSVSKLISLKICYQQFAGWTWVQSLVQEGSLEKRM